MPNKRLKILFSGLARLTAPWLAAGLSVFFIPPGSAFADTDSAGSVIAARRDAWAERGAARPQLYSKSPVFSGDRLSTNPVGRLQVLFNDDSVLMLAPDSQATVTEYVYSAETDGNAFNISLAKGVTSLISGRMVENEPGSMRVETPEITVGIQGTALAVESNGGVSKVMIAHATPGKPTIVICGEDQRKTYLEESGMVLIMNAEAQCVPEIRRMTADEQFFLRSLSLPLSGPGLSEAAAPTSPAADLNASAPGFAAQQQLALQDNSGAGILQANPSAQSFAGTYSGTATINGAPGSYGWFNVGVSDLTTGPTVDTFGLFVTGDSDNSRIATLPQTPVNGLINAGGGFNLSLTDADGVMAIIGGVSVPDPVLSVQGGFAGNNVHITWEASVSSGAAFHVDGSGSGERGDYAGW